MGEQRVQRVHQQPRMSSNALARYMTANAANRERILYDQKFPSAFKVTWYREASRVITRYLLDPDRDESIISVWCNRLQAAPIVSRNEQQRINDNQTALQCFLRCHNDIQYDSLAAHRSPQTSQIKIEGVTISVGPDVILRGSYRGTACLGAVKVYLAKNDPLTNDTSDVISALVHRFVGSMALNSEQCKHQHSLVVDVFGQSCRTAPRAITRRQREIDAACREIALRWSSIQR